MNTYGVLKFMNLDLDGVGIGMCNGKFGRFVIGDDADQSGGVFVRSLYTLLVFSFAYCSKAVSLECWTAEISFIEAKS